MRMLWRHSSCFNPTQLESTTSAKNNPGSRPGCQITPTTFNTPFGRTQNTTSVSDVKAGIARSNSWSLTRSYIARPSRVGAVAVFNSASFPTNSSISVGLTRVWMAFRILAKSCLSSADASTTGGRGLDPVRIGSSNATGMHNDRANAMRAHRAVDEGPMNRCLAICGSFSI
jgi:hypothetical protein